MMERHCRLYASVHFDSGYRVNGDRTSPPTRGGSASEVRTHGPLSVKEGQCQCCLQRIRERVRDHRGERGSLIARCPVAYVKSCQRTFRRCLTALQGRRFALTLQAYKLPAMVIVFRFVVACVFISPLSTVLGCGSSKTVSSTPPTTSNSAPSIVTQPADASAQVGQTASFTVVAQG